MSNSRGIIKARVVISCRGEIEEFMIEAPSREFVEVFMEFLKNIVVLSQSSRITLADIIKIDKNSLQQ